MKLNCLRSDLSNAVSNVQRAVSTKSTLPALEGVLLIAKDNKITISGYDLEIGIVTNIEATVIEPGEIVVSARLFGEIVKKLPEEIVCIETDERMVTYITSGQASYQIIGISSSEYPDLPTFEQTDSIKINAGVLKNMIRQTSFAIAESKAKPIYTGSLFDIQDNTLTICAVDGFRMAIRKENISSNGCSLQIVIPGKTQSEVLKLIDDDDEEVELIVGQRHTIFRVREYSVVSRLIEGIFLDYMSTVPKGNDTEVTINTRTIINSVERMSLLSFEKVQTPLRCKILSDEIKLSCKTSIGKASDSFHATISGKEVEIGFNNRYLLDALRNTDTDEVRLIFNGSLTPMVIKPISGDSFIFIVVPMKLGLE